MNPVAVPGETRVFGKPANWDPAIHGECGKLSIRDGRDETSGAFTMTSHWEPSKEELQILIEGGRIELRIFGTVHPVVSVGVTELDERLIVHG